MRILTNEYPSNLPGNHKNLKLGAARFARDFSAFIATQKEHEWIGLTYYTFDEKNTIEHLATEGNITIYGVDIPDIGAQELARYNSLDAVFAAYQEPYEAMRAWVRDMRPDVFSLNGFSPFYWLLARAAEAEGVPVCIQHAGIFAEELAAFATIYDPAYVQIAMAMEVDTSVRAQGNIFLNEHSLRAFKKWYPNSAILGVDIIPLPHAGWEQHALPAPRSASTRKIGVVARWDRIKNHEAVLAFAEAVQHVHPEWEVVSVTTIPDTPARADFKEAYKKHVTVVPPMDRDALKEFYASLDVLLVPSIFETVGGVVEEALATGVPSLISHGVGWGDEYRACGMDSWIVDYADPARVIARLEEQFARTTWPEFACLRERIAVEHDPHTVFTRYLTLFKKVADNRA